MRVPLDKYQTIYFIMNSTRMSVAISMRVPLNKYETIYFIMNSSAMPH
jgi:hypothetical protein